MPARKKKNKKVGRSSKIESKALLLVAVAVISIFVVISLFVQNLIALTQPNEIYAEELGNK